MNLLSNQDENELLSRLKTGDEQAFSEIYTLFWKPLFVIAAKKTNNLSEAEEIVQEIFLDVWNRRQSLEINTSLSSYFSACVKYKVISLLAKKNRALKYQQHALVKSELDCSTENWLQFEELKKELQKETDRLPEKCKLVFRLSRDKGLSQKQIAIQLGISEKTVESHLAKALRTLRMSLGQFFSHFL
ncbi:MAG TPA: RNA polymerase sigma-70 factor [Chitinophagaceae bacterium]